MLSNVLGTVLFMPVSVGITSVSVRTITALERFLFNLLSRRDMIATFSLYFASPADRTRRHRPSPAANPASMIRAFVAVPEDSNTIANVAENGGIHPHVTRIGKVLSLVGTMRQLPDIAKFSATIRRSKVAPMSSNAVLAV